MLSTYLWFRFCRANRLTVRRVLLAILALLALAVGIYAVFMLKPVLEGAL